MSIIITVIIDLGRNCQCTLKPVGEFGEGIQDSHTISGHHFIDECCKGRKRFLYKGGMWRIKPQPND